MPLRTAEAVWQGKLPEGKGNMKLGSGAYEGEYSFASRFQESRGTNPEELIGAAHAGCFSMALSHMLGQAGYNPERIRTAAKVHLDRVSDGFKITAIELETEAKVQASMRKHSWKRLRPPSKDALSLRPWPARKSSCGPHW